MALRAGRCLLDRRFADRGNDGSMFVSRARGEDRRPVCRTADRGNNGADSDPRDLKIKLLRQRVRDLEIQQEIRRLRQRVRNLELQREMRKTETESSTIVRDEGDGGKQQPFGYHPSQFYEPICEDQLGPVCLSEVKPMYDEDGIDCDEKEYSLVQTFLSGITSREDEPMKETDDNEYAEVSPDFNRRSVVPGKSNEDLKETGVKQEEWMIDGLCSPECARNQRPKELLDSSEVFTEGKSCNFEFQNTSVDDSCNRGNLINGVESNKGNSFFGEDDNLMGSPTQLPSILKKMGDTGPVSRCGQTGSINFAGQQGYGSPWSVFEDQALVVLVHTMSAKWEFISDAINITLQFKCIYCSAKECKQRHKLLMGINNGEGVDSAVDSRSSQSYPATWPDIPEESGRQLFQRVMLIIIKNRIDVPFDPGGYGSNTKLEDEFF